MTICPFVDMLVISIFKDYPFLVGLSYAINLQPGVRGGKDISRGFSGCLSGPQTVAWRGHEPPEPVAGSGGLAVERRRRPCRPTGAVRKAVREISPRRSPGLAAALPHARPARIPKIHRKMDLFRSSPIPRHRSSRFCRRIWPLSPLPKKSSNLSAQRLIRCCMFSTRPSGPMCSKIKRQGNGGERGIRTLGTGYYQYDGLANRCFRPLSHLSAQGGRYPRRCVPFPQAPFSASAGLTRHGRKRTLRSRAIRHGATGIPRRK